MKIYNLEAYHDARASFYGKAKIKEVKNDVILISYSTEILRLNTRSGKIHFITRSAADFSATTCRHINEFLKQYTAAARGYSKKELLKMAGIL